MINSFKLMRFFIRVMMRLVTTVELHGLENLPATGNFIIAANHLGRLDTGVLMAALNREDVIIPVAEKYKNHPIFGPIGRAGNVVWLNRFDADFRAMRAIMERMEQGGVMVIAPEGTRSKTASLQEGKPGVAFLASKTGYPILPVALTGTEDQGVLKNLKRLRRSHVTATAGKPFKVEIPKGPGRDQALKDATDQIMCQIAAMLPESYRGVYADHPKLKELLDA